MSDTNLTQLIVNHLTRDELHNADFTDHANELFVQKDHAGVSIGGVGVDALDTTNITNCITNIPQDIKLELNNGTLTVKAGSKIYVPNGTGVFNVVNITSDFNVIYGSGISNLILCLNTSGTGVSLTVASECYSGSTEPSPSSSYRQIWYDTTNNIVKTRGTSSTEWTHHLSLPIAIVNCTGTNKFTIGKVFNGFGYIGSTVFTLPGLKALYPNGRNADGTLKNGNVICNSVQISSAFTGTEDHVVILQANGRVGWYSRRQYIYDKENNYIYNANDGARLSSCVVGTFDVVNNKVQNFKPFDAFRALDYNDSEYIANCAMPSDRYVDLTLPASGGTITAPADGYITLTKDCSAAGQMVYLRNATSGLNSGLFSNGANKLRCNIAVSKGDVITTAYTASGTTETFRFVYANGSK